MHKKKPYLINFPKLGNSMLGYISVAEKESLPIEVKRLFWTFYIPEEVVRGRHAHYLTEMILVATSGRIIVNTEMPNKQLDVFILDKPDIGLFIPKLCWHTMQYSHNAVQLCISSTEYDENDYIRDYNTFKMLEP